MEEKEQYHETKLRKNYIEQQDELTPEVYRSHRNDHVFWNDILPSRRASIGFILFDYLDHVAVEEELARIGLEQNKVYKKKPKRKNKKRLQKEEMEKEELATVMPFLKAPGLTELVLSYVEQHVTQKRYRQFFNVFEPFLDATSSETVSCTDMKRLHAHAAQSLARRFSGFLPAWVNGKCEELSKDVVIQDRAGKKE